MHVRRLLEELARTVPATARVGTRRHIEASVPTALGRLRVAGDARIDPAGRRREQFWCNGARLHRHELLRLTCPESDCPQARAVCSQWQAFERRRRCAASPARRDAGAVGHETSPVEHELTVAGHRCVARPALFRCFTSCPNGAHPPMWIDKRGYDLFEDGVCVAGGSTAVDGRLRAPGRTRPRIPDLPSARAYLLARSFEAAALLRRCGSTG